jgi:succinoglycan biosynthesis transport protein ExoP
MVEKKPDSRRRKPGARRSPRLSSSALGPPGFVLRSPAASSWSGVPTRVLPAGMSAPAAPADSLLVVLWRSRGVMLLCLLAVVAGGAAYIQIAPPIYMSTAKLYLDYAGIRVSNPYEPGSRPQTDKYLSTQAELIKSRPILLSATDSLKYRRLRTFAAADAPAAYLQKNMTVEIGKKDEVISLSLCSPYADEAADIINQVVDAYMDYRSKHEQRSSAQVLKIYQDQLRSAEAERAEKQQRLDKFKSDHMPLALGSEQGDAMMMPYYDFQSALTQARIKTMAAKDFYSAVRDLAPNPVALRQFIQLQGNIGTFTLADQQKSLLEAKAVEKRGQKNSWLKSYTEELPAVAGLTTELSQIEAQVRKIDDQYVKGTVDAAERDYLRAKQAEEALARSFDEQQKQAMTLNADVAQCQALRLEVEQLTKRCDALQQQVWQVSQLVGEDTGQLRMAILERATAADLPSEPQKGRIMAMAVILGLLLGGGAAVARDWRDQTLRSTDEIAAVLGVPVLGAVPAMSRRQRMSERGRKVLLQPDSREAEAFRTIRTAVLFGASDSVKTILITSPIAGEGKSTLVSNLAIAMACAGQKTLVLDADFRKPTQHIIFRLNPRERCLSDVFAGTLALGAAVQPTGIETLHVLTCGYQIANPAEVLHSSQFAHLLTCLAEVYDRIVIDAPPVTVVTDAQILGALCDATVLVLRADKSVRKVAQHAIDSLQSVGAHLLGVVVNEVYKHGTRYGYYYDRYRKYYGSRSKGADGRPKNSITVVPSPAVPSAQKTPEAI